MAKAFKCDRCGVYYDKEVDNAKFAVVGFGPAVNRLDFCLPCTIALQDWMSLPERTKRKDLDDYREAGTVKRPVGRPKKVDAGSLTAKAEEAKKQEKLSKTLDEMAEKRGDYE